METRTECYWSEVRGLRTFDSIQNAVDAFKETLESDMSKTIEMNCGGACCKRFGLDVSPGDLFRMRVDAMHQEYRRGVNSRDLADVFRDVLKSADGLHPDDEEDIHMIEDMVIPLGEFNYWPETPENVSGRTVYHYSCRHLSDGRCSVYERRPEMCSRYPYGRTCGHAARGNCGGYRI